MDNAEDVKEKIKRMLPFTILLIVLVIAVAIGAIDKTSNEPCDHEACPSEGEKKCDVLEIYECRDGCWSYVDTCSYDCVGEGICILTTVPPS